MTATPNLGIVLIDTHQAQKEVTHNDGMAKIDSVLTESMSMPVDDGANTLDVGASEWVAHISLIPGTLSADFSITLPSGRKREIIFSNETLYDATVTTGSGKTALVESGITAKCYSNGTDVWATAGGSAPAGAQIFTDLLDVPSYSGAAKKLVRVNSGETGLEYISNTAQIIEYTADHTLVIGDAKALIALNDSNPLTLTIPTKASEDWETSTTIDIVQTGAGQVTIIADSGVTLICASSPKTRTQYSILHLVCLDDDIWVLYGDLEGTGATAIFDFGTFLAGPLQDGELLVRLIMTQSVTFPANLPGSYGSAITASASNVSLDIEKNNTSMGSIDFNTSDTATFTAGSDIVLVPGDILSVIAPSPADSTLADVSFTLTGTRN